MSYQPKDFSHLIGMKGFSEKLLKNHFTLYEAYVKNTNTLHEELVEIHRAGKTTSPAFAEMKRRFGWEFNGMRLHEYYFENLGGKKGLQKESKLYHALEQNFGGFERWQDDFKATGEMRGIGWAVLYQDDRTGSLFNTWIDEHDVGHLSGCRPILIMDVFEHAFVLDYGTDKTDYIEAFFKNIEWEIAERRLLGTAGGANMETADLARTGSGE